MPTVWKEPPEAVQHAATEIDAVTGACPYRRLAALVAAVHEVRIAVQTLLM